MAMKKTEEVVIRNFEQLETKIRIVGNDPLIVHNWSEKAKEVALSDENMRNVLLENALNELRAFRRKYNQLSELADVFFEIKKIEQAVS